MSQNRVCCNCRHNIRKKSDTGHIYCECEVTGKYMGYVKVMNGWCRHWSKERIKNESKI